MYYAKKKQNELENINLFKTNKKEKENISK
jgi:hypothetical protein